MSVISLNVYGVKDIPQESSETEESRNLHITCLNFDTCPFLPNTQEAKMTKTSSQDLEFQKIFDSSR